MRGCEECRHIWENDFHYIPPCDGCDYPGIRPENLKAWIVFSHTGAALFDGMGGINLANAHLVCEGLGYEWDSTMMQKIIAAAGAYLKKSQETR